MYFFTGIIHQPLPNSICDIDSLSEDDQLLMLRLQHEEMGMLLALEQFTEDIKKTPLSLLLVSGKYRLQDVLPTDENNTCAVRYHYLLCVTLRLAPFGFATKQVSNRSMILSSRYSGYTLCDFDVVPHKTISYYLCIT